MKKVYKEVELVFSNHLSQKNPKFKKKRDLERNKRIYGMDLVEHIMVSPASNPAGWITAAFGPLLLVYI